MLKIGDFRYVFLEAFKHFLIENKAKVHVNGDDNKNIVISVRKTPLVNNAKNTILEWVEIEKFLIIDEDMDFDEKNKVQYKFDKELNLEYLSIGYFNFFDISFEWKLDKKFFSTIMNMLPEKHIDNFIKITQDQNDDRFLHFYDLEENKEKFWLLFEKLHTQITSNQLLEIYPTVNNLIKNKKETITEIDARLYAFFSIRADLFEKDKDQLSMYNAMQNILGYERGLKYKNFLSNHVKEAIDKESFIHFKNNHVYCIELDYYTFYNQIQIYPFGGYGHTVFFKMIEKILEECKKINNLKILDIDFLYKISDVKHLKIFIHTEDSAFDKNKFLHLIEVCAKYMTEAQTHDHNLTNIEIQQFLLSHILRQKLKIEHQEPKIFKI